MRLQNLLLFLLLACSAKADIIGMIKPNIVNETKENGKITQMKVEYETWNYWHTQRSHVWTEVYHFNSSGVLILSYGDGDWASAKKKYWKHKYQILDRKRLKDYYYNYGDSITTYPETKAFLSYIDTVEISNEFSNLTVEKLKKYITEHTKAFESRDKMLSGNNKTVEKAVEVIANEFFDKLNQKEQPQPESSYTWLYFGGGILVLASLVLVLLKRHRKKYRR
jgi:hypothetical protein